MNRLKIILPLFLMVMAACALMGQERRALAVGVGRYKDPAWARINADNDLEYVGRILDMYGFDDVTYLRNEMATKAALVSAFEDLADRCKAGDVVYVHFSGHGQQVTDLDGDEDDGLDEAWIPYDAYRVCCSADDGSKHFIDDEINFLLAGIRRKVGPDGRILVVVDACHSGHSSKAHVKAGDAFVCRGVNDVFIPEYKQKTRPVISEDWILISACEADQVNFEVRRLRVGKLTYCLYKLSSFLPRLSNDGLKEMLHKLMDSDDMLAPMPQNPHFDGDRQYKVQDVFKR